MAGLSSFRNSLVIISITILLILGTQIYRTVNNYQLNKQQFINDVQLALDLSVEKYYADKARSHFSLTTTSDQDSIRTQVTALSMTLDSLEVDREIIMTEDLSTIFAGDSNAFHYSWSSDSQDVDVERQIRRFQTDSGSGTMLRMSTRERDSSDFVFAFGNFTQLTQKIMISTSEEKMDLQSLNKILESELARRKLSMDYDISYLRGPASNSAQRSPKFPLFASAKSTYLMPRETLNIHFENATLQILKRGAWELIISFLIVFSVIGALLYLYRIIKAQKELAMIKDDLIGNVSHEFKTPIATVSTALEGIVNFNEANDPEKTKRYVEMSRDQLTKLNLMVEKLMETATIDSGEMEVNLVETDISALTKKVVENFKIGLTEKQLSAKLPDQALLKMVDPFHFENIVTNLIDNAVKYGGDEITVILKSDDPRVVLQVIDNGGSIDKAEKQRVFEKLYRIPKGNQHDVKGFGIGLYYTKAMVEKHGGQISLEVSPGRTCFTVSL